MLLSAIFSSASRKAALPWLGFDVDLAFVHDPAARIGCDVDSRAGQEDRADGATIVPVYLERILPCVPFQNFTRKIFHTGTCRPKAQRNIECLASARFNIARK